MHGPGTSPVLPQRIWWPWDQSAERVGFTRHFNLPAAMTGVLHVAASGNYTAWLDGTALSPPAAHAPSWRIIHRIPLQLPAGHHRLSFEATPGVHGQPFLLACLDWAAPDSVDSAAGRLATSGDWLMCAGPPTGWASAAADAEPPGNWRTAWAFDGVWAEPWGMPCNVPDDWCRLSHGWQEVCDRLVTRAVEVHGGAAACGAAARISDNGALHLRPAHPCPPAPFPIGDVRRQDLAYRTREAHSHILNHRLELFEARAPHVVLDTGAETFGRVRIRLQRGGPAIVAVTTGESLPEVHKHLGRVSDVFALQDGESFATGPTGFRYIKVLGLSAGPDGAIELDPVIVQHIRYPVPPIGTFECDDDALNKIWNLSARTVHLCMQNEIWDGIKRDQLPWMGDLYCEALAIYHAFGDARLARWSLGVLGEIGPVPDRPLSRQRYPGLQSMWKQPNTDINGIPSYTLWWVIGLADYLRYTGDHTLIEDLADELTATLAHVASWVAADGCWRHRHGWDYVDWAPLTAAERATFCHLLACQVLGLGAELLESINRPGATCRATRDRMRAYARDSIWHNGTAEFGPAHHIPAMLIRGGVLSVAECTALFTRTLRHDEPFRMTYWHRYADLEAAAIVDEIDWGLQYIRRHWGTALALGMTSLWEAFDPAWHGPDPHAVSMIAAEHARYGGYETSLCHGWSAGPAVWLHRAVLGVSPASPGFATIDFKPALGGLQHARGTIPTPNGPIQVELRQPSRAHLSTPAGVVIRIPDDVRQAWNIRLDETPAQPRSGDDQ